MDRWNPAPTTEFHMRWTTDGTNPTTQVTVKWDDGEVAKNRIINSNFNSNSSGYRIWLSEPLTPGTQYTITITNNTDGTTLYSRVNSTGKENLFMVF